MSADFRPNAATRTEGRFYLAVFAACVLFHFWGATAGWQSLNLPGVEYRQAQTAISAHFIQQENDFSLAYPTPVLGKPWSIPMEFPLYQWTVVGVSNLTGTALTQSGRAVSLGCFYLTLPALFLVLGRMGLAAGRRWIVLAVVVSSPLYIYYSRAFLIETMALMFGVWFWLAFEQAVERRSGWWLAAASLTGMGAGLVKVTTLAVYLLPAGLWALRRLWRGRRDGVWRVDMAWMMAAVALPFAATGWWTHFAGVTRMRNPCAQFLAPDQMMDFTLGTWATRLAPELWAMKWTIIATSLSWLPAMAACVFFALLTARQRGLSVLLCGFVFTAVLAVFPVLYAWHEYYFIASTVLLLMAMGLAIAALAESGHPLWVVGLALLAVSGGQAWRYLDCDYPGQKGISLGGTGLTQSLRGLTRQDEVLVITGQDWNSMIPFYASRRALMLRGDIEHNEAQLDRAFTALAGEKIGALLVTGPVADKANLVRRVRALGIDPRPLYCWEDITVYLPQARWDKVLRALQEKSWDMLRWAPGVVLPEPKRMAGQWYELARVRPDQRLIFQTMSPPPVRFWTSFGPGLEVSGGLAAYNAHPTTRLVFHLPAGAHTLRTKVWLPPAAYDLAMDRNQVSDGVEITLAELGPSSGRHVLFTRVIDPRNNPADRGIQPLKIDFSLVQEAEVELFFGPGPNGRDTRDWIKMDRLLIQ